MTRASFLLIALSSLALPSCSSLSLGGSESDAGGSSTSTSGSSRMGGSGGNGGGGAFDAAPVGGQDGGGASGTSPCQDLEVPDLDCSSGTTPKYICEKREDGWAWDYYCAPSFAAEALPPSSGGNGGTYPYPIDAPVEGTCTHNGKTYPYGASWQEECNTCWCNPVSEGGLMCTAKGCRVDAGPAPSGGAGGNSPIDAPMEGGQGGSTELTCTYKGNTYSYGVGWKDGDSFCGCQSVGGGGELYPVCWKPEWADGGPGLGCDTVAAARAALAMGIDPLGGGTISSATLPSDLASDPNWGVKDTECREGGYDLSPVAGKTVCLISFPTVETCQELPAKVWIVMSEGAVNCVYRSAALTPGIYSAQDPLCSRSDAGTPPCPGPNPAERTCKKTASECVPSFCTCGSPGSPNDWRCTTDCQMLRFCPPDAGAVDML